MITASSLAPSNRQNRRPFLFGSPGFWLQVLLLLYPAVPAKRIVGEAQKKLKEEEELLGVEEEELESQKPGDQ